MKSSKTSPDVRGALLRSCRPFSGKKVGLLLSGGIDSASILFALQEVGAVPRAYSFTLDGTMSSDFSLARRNAAEFGCPFKPIFLPAGLDQLQVDMRFLVSLGAKKKTDFECGWPMLYSYSSVEEEYVFSGMGADGHFCISKKGMIHFRDKIDVFRRGLYDSPTYAQQHTHKRLAEGVGKQAVLPYMTQDMRQEFLGTTWEQVNKPRQKQPILSAFPENFARMRVLPHINLQLGDSGIATHLSRLLGTSWGQGCRSVASIYGKLVRGEL